MIFAGLPFATLVTIAAAAGGLTVLFYILKLRRRPVADARRSRGRASSSSRTTRTRRGSRS